MVAAAAAAAAVVVVHGVVVVSVIHSCFLMTPSIFAVFQHVCLLSPSILHITPTHRILLAFNHPPLHFLQVRLRNDAWTTKNKHYGAFVDCMQAMTPPDFTHHAPSCARQPSVPVKHKSTPAHWSAHVEFQVRA